MSMKRIFDKTLLKFLLVGLGNTLLSAAIMYLLYNLAGLGYWPSTTIAYVAGGTVSFFLNRSFTFENKGRLWPAAGRFALTVAVCYVLAYSLAQPLVALALGQLAVSAQWRDHLAMLTGMGLYTGLNYIGQRWFAFRRAA